jgi:hypothetical protein
MRALKGFKMTNLVSLTVLVLSALLLAAFCAPMFSTPEVEEYSTCASSADIKMPLYIYVVSMSIMVSLLLVSVVIRVKAATIGNKFTVWTSTISTVLMLINSVIYVWGFWIPHD